MVMRGRREAPWPPERGLPAQVVGQLPMAHKHVFMYVTGLALDILLQRRQSGLPGISRQDLGASVCVCVRLCVCV
jgi:hypothetical protein